ncbi:unnamed protein product [Linum tenue]|uniref:Legume lectin domain-containing protein n=1 Tax=Linum tenue TaxID=586396 RepID=A0AAV0R111_9ROSI|nr:unnamed protein product [Linum tenue]
MPPLPSVYLLPFASLSLFRHGSASSISLPHLLAPHLIHFSTLLPAANSQNPEPTTTTSFTYNGFHKANLLIDSQAKILSDGMLQLTNHTQLVTGHAFHHQTFKFNPNSSTDSLSFSTTFVFAIVPESPLTGGHGIAFIISPPLTSPTPSPASTWVSSIPPTWAANRTTSSPSRGKPGCAPGSGRSSIGN